MEILEALKPTGKATMPTSDGYAYLDGVYLKWKDGTIVGLKGVLSDLWLPYHEEKEIRPERAGELWSKGGMDYYTLFESHRGTVLCFVDINNDIDNVRNDAIHNKNGWTRLYPPVEDEGVERIEIEGACMFPGVLDYLAGPCKVMDSLRERIDHNGLNMKVILEIPKEK